MATLTTAQQIADTLPIDNENGTALCICNMCTTILNDEENNYCKTMYDISSIEDDVIDFDTTEDEVGELNICPICQTDEYLMDV